MKEKYNNVRFPLLYQWLCHGIFFFLYINFLFFLKIARTEFKLKSRKCKGAEEGEKGGGAND